MHTLHTRAASIYKSWAEEERKQRLQLIKDHQGVNQLQLGDQYVDEVRGVSEVPQMAVGIIDAGTSTLWMTCWCPLLQGNSIVGMSNILQLFLVSQINDEYLSINSNL